MKINVLFSLLFSCIGLVPSVHAQKKTGRPVNHYFFVQPIHAAIQMKEDISPNEQPKIIATPNNFSYLLFLETAFNSKPIISTIIINNKSYQASVIKVSSPYAIPGLPDSKKIKASGSNALYQLTNLEINEPGAEAAASHRVIIKGKLNKKTFCINDTARLLPAMAAQ